MRVERVHQSEAVASGELLGVAGDQLVESGPEAGAHGAHVLDQLPVLVALDDRLDDARPELGARVARGVEEGVLAKCASTRSPKQQAAIG